MEQNLRIFNGYGTHLVPLVRALTRVGGDVLEIGCGPFSTPVIHSLMLLTSPQRHVISLESNPSWIQALESFKAPWHLFDLFGNPLNIVELWGTRHSIVLVDFGMNGDRLCYKQRLDVVDQFKGTNAVIILHDTEEYEATDQTQWEETRKSFRFVWDYKEVCPWTTTLTNDEDYGRFITKQ